MVELKWSLLDKSVWTLRIVDLKILELFYDRGNHHEFATLVKELAAPGDLMKSTVFDFEFNNVEKQNETYTGINVRLRCEATETPSSLSIEYFLLILCFLSRKFHWIHF
jgi:hypothetical protein